eukprot:gene46994-62922_t
MIAYNNAIEASSNFKDLTSLSIKALDRAFEYFDVESAYEVSTKEMTMSKYLVIPRRADSPMTHAGGSTEETVCEIAKNLLHYPGPSEYLMAIPADTKVATFAVLKDDALCSIEVTQSTLETWRKDVTNIQDAINSFQSARDHAENVLDQALGDLDEAYENSIGFKGYTPSDDISVYGALEQMGSNDLEYTFQRALHEMYKFQVIRRHTA